MHMREGALAAAADSPARSAGRMAGVTGVPAAGASRLLAPGGNTSGSSPSIAFPATCRQHTIYTLADHSSSWQQNW